MNRRRWWCAAAVLTMAAALTACGSDDSSADDDRPSTAEESPTPSDSGPEETAPAPEPTLTKESFFTEVEAAVAQSGSVHVVADLADAASGEGDLEFGSDAALSALAMTINDADVRLADGTYYVNLGQTSGGMFLQVPTGSSGEFSTVFEPVLAQINPLTQLSLFADAMTGFTPSNETLEVDGVTTTAYQLTLDPAQVLSDSQAQLLGDLPASMVVTVRLGPDQLPREISSELDGFDLMISYSGWGDAVEIAAPPADQVVDGSAFGL